jgi:EmrB/QacA subfamily drug resistance transporter
MAPTDQHREDLVIEAPGAEEVGSVAWPLLLRDRVQGRVERSERGAWIVLAAALFGLLAVTCTITILAVSIPTIADDLGTSETTLTWLITGPVLAFAVIGPSVGKLGDLWGYRRIYLLGLTGAAVFAGLSALAWNAGSLLTFRVLAASIGAALGPASMAMITKSFPPERRVQAMGYWSLVMAGGPVLGVIIGGQLVEAFGWRLLFVGQVPLMLAALAVAAAVLPDTDRGRREPFDLAGSVTLALSATSLLVALNRGPVLGWSHPLVVAGFVLSPVFVAAFIIVERRSDHPLIPLEYFRKRNFAFPIGVQAFLNFAYMGGFILTPLLLQNVFDWQADHAGNVSIARPLAFAIAGPLAGFVTVRVGERSAIVTGSLLVGASMVGMAAVTADTSDIVIMGALALAGVGAGASMPATAASIANAVDERDLGVAGAAQQMMTEVGLVIGIQVMQTVQVTRAESVGALASYGDAYLVGAAACVVAALFGLMVRSTPRQRVPAEGAAPEADVALAASTP